MRSMAEKSSMKAQRQRSKTLSSRPMLRARSPRAVAVGGKGVLDGNTLAQLRPPFRRPPGHLRCWWSPSCAWIVGVCPLSGLAPVGLGRRAPPSLVLEGNRTTGPRMGRTSPAGQVTLPAFWSIRESSFVNDPWFRVGVERRWMSPPAPHSSDVQPPGRKHRSMNTSLTYP